MNDHIAKPINVGKMFKTMAKWITPKNPIKESAERENDYDDTFIDIPELEGVDIAFGLDIMQGNRKLYIKLLRKFYDSQKNFDKQFKSAQSSDDKTAAERYAHSLKGVAGNIGAKEVQITAASLEQACERSIEGLELEQQVETVQLALSKVITSLTCLITDDTKLSLSNDILDQKEFDSLLQRLRTLLEDDDTDATNVIDELHNLPGIYRYKETLSLLTKAINGYDFENGLELIEDLQNITG
jgi:HPt (histidine-containing phosphotransfer) domain-containing protein